MVFVTWLSPPLRMDLGFGILPLRLWKDFLLCFVSHFGSDVAEGRTLYSLAVADKRNINLADP